MSFSIIKFFLNYLNLKLGIENKKIYKYFTMESSILAQDERWRRA